MIMVMQFAILFDCWLGLLIFITLCIETESHLELYYSKLFPDFLCNFHFFNTLRKKISRFPTCLGTLNNFLMKSVSTHLYKHQTHIIMKSSQSSLSSPRCKCCICNILVSTICWISPCVYLETMSKSPSTLWAPATCLGCVPLETISSRSEAETK